MITEDRDLSKSEDRLRVLRDHERAKAEAEARRERRERRSWKHRVLAYIERRSQPRGTVTPVVLNFRGGKEALQKLRRSGQRPPLNPRAVAKFRRIHEARRERNLARAAARR